MTAITRRPSGKSVITWWCCVSLSALIFRMAILPFASRYGYQYDHDGFVRWGIQATDVGLLTLYDRPPPRWDMQVMKEGQRRITQQKEEHLCNYPPLAIYLLYCSGVVFKAVGSDRLINTCTSRAVFESWSILADVVLALGCAAIVARLKPGGAARWTYLLVLAAPPFWLDSVIWGQMDSVALAPAMWMLWAVIAGRWWLAGLFFGLMAGFKTQALLLVPLWIWILLVCRPWWKPVLSLGMAMAVLQAVALPFTLHSGWAWWRSAYLENLTVACPQTTLMAFNLWYVNLLSTDCGDVMVRWWGLTKDTWGRVFLAIGLAGGYVWLLRRWRRDHRGLVLFAALSLLFLVMLPTRVHERYLILMLPFLALATAIWPRFWPGLGLLLLVATAQMTWPMWLSAVPSQWPMIERQITQSFERRIPPAERSKHLPWLTADLASAKRHYQSRRSRTVGLEWTLTGYALAGALWTAAVAAAVKPREAREEPSTE